MGAEMDEVSVGHRDRVSDASESGQAYRQQFQTETPAMADMEAPACLPAAQIGGKTPDMLNQRCAGRELMMAEIADIVGLGCHRNRKVLLSKHNLR